MKRSTQIMHHRAMARMLRAELAELKKREVEIPHDIFETTKFLLEEITEGYESIVVLLKKKHFRSCLTIARPIVENLINLQYIYKDKTVVRAKNYKAHAGNLYFKKSEKYKKEFTEDQKVVYEVLKSTKEESEKTGTDERYWDGKSIKQICNELELNHIYEDWYVRLSGYIHSQYRNTEWDFESDRPYNDFLRRMLFQSMPVLTLQALKDINDKYDLLEGGMIMTDYPYEGAVLSFSINNNHIYECTKCGIIPEREIEKNKDNEMKHKNCGNKIEGINPPELSFKSKIYFWVRYLLKNRRV